MLTIGDFNSFWAFLGHPSDEADDLDFAVEVWNLLFSDIANKHAPIKKIRIKGTQTPWLKEN